MYMPRPPEYEGGHEAKLEIHDPFFTFRGGSEQAAREVAVATLALVLECERREVQKGRNRSLLGSLMVGGGRCSLFGLFCEEGGGANGCSGGRGLGMVCGLGWRF